MVRAGIASPEQGEAFLHELEVLLSEHVAVMEKERQGKRSNISKRLFG